jgi:hypothetical protein
MRWKDRISRFWIFPAGRQLRLAGARTAPRGKTQLAGSKDGGWVYTDRHPGSKMEIPGSNLSAEAVRATDLLGGKSR